MASFPESNIYMQCYTLFSADLDLLIQIYFLFKMSEINCPF